MSIRKLHRFVGLAFSAFFLLTACTGLALLWRNAGLYSGDTKELLLGLHNWEAVAHYVGAVLASALICITVTGLILFAQSVRRKP